MPQVLRSRSAVDIAGQTIELTFRCLPKLVVLYGLYGLVVLVLAGTAIATFWDDFLLVAERLNRELRVGETPFDGVGGAASFTFLVVVAVSALLAAVPGAASVPAVGEQFMSRRVTLRECLLTGLRKFWTVTGIQFVIGLLSLPVALVGGIVAALGYQTGSVGAMFLALVLLVVGGVLAAFVLVKYYTAVAVAAIEDQRLGGALARSGALSKGHRWRILFVWAIVWFFGTIISLGGSIVSSTLSAAFGTDETRLWIVTAIGLVIGLVTQFLSSMMMSVSQATVYFDLRGRVEDFDAENLEQLVEDIGRRVERPATEA